MVKSEEENVRKGHSIVIKEEFNCSFYESLNFLSSCTMMIRF